jgi:superfamily II DNA/RNA helicase
MNTEVITPTATVPNGFETLGLHDSLLRAVAAAGYTEPTPVQLRAIPAALDGHDLMVSSRTGSGKTAAFVLPALMRVLAARDAARAIDRAAAADAVTAPAPTESVTTDGPRQRPDHRQRRPMPPATGPRVLVLTPTRELALQLTRAAGDYGRFIPGLRIASVVGGVPYAAQLKALRGPLDILIATPGRMIDHMESGRLPLGQVELLVLDEADRMLDLGFIEPIEHIAAALPAARQTMMTSATFGGNVGRLAQGLLRDPQRIEVASHTDTHAGIEQRLHWADDGRHRMALLEHLLADRELDQALVFTSTQNDAEWVAQRLAEIGHAVEAMHGGMPQGRRNRVLQGFRGRRLRVLVATDVAARGIDVPGISHVINFGLPMTEEDYVHRIGRTGRAGRQGLAVTLAEARDAGMLRRIERFTTQRIPPAVIQGLEPQRPMPNLAHRPTGPSAGPGRGAPHRGKPGYGGKPGHQAAYGARPGFGNRPEHGGPAREGWRADAPRPAAGAPRDAAPARGGWFGDNRGPRDAQATRGDRPARPGEARRGPAAGPRPFGDRRR